MDETNKPSPVAETSAAEFTPEQGAAAQTQLEKMITPAIRQVIGTVFRGVLVSSQGVPPHVVLNVIARETGSLLAEAIQGDLMGVLKLRKDFKKAFEDGVTHAKIIQTPPSNVPPLKLNGG